MWGRFTAILVVAALLAGCGDDSAELATTTTTSQAPTTTTTGVTGQTSCVETDSTWSGPALADDVPFTSLDITYDCDYTLSDERVSGSGPAVLRVDMSLDGVTRVGQISGTVVISNEGGTWEGTVSGTTTWTLGEAHVHVMDAVYPGSGDYEGLRFVMTNEGVDPSDLTTTGRIEPAE